MREMKDSGIEWIGKIPSDWTVSKITHILDLTHPYAIGDGDHGIIKADDYTDDGIPYIRVNNLGWATELQLSNVVYITQQQNELIKSSTLKPDDILFAKTGATIGKTAIIPKSVAIANTTSHVGKISVSREHCAKFFYYVLSSYIGYKQFWDFASLKTTRPELSIDEIKQTILISPTSYAEQKAISDHLDLKCKECDTLVIDIQSQIETLEEYKRSVITEAVTKGLDPDVEMRDSGIAWVGDIPAHWITHPLYFYFGVRKNKNALGLETNLLSLSYGKIIRKDINSNGGLLPESFNTYNIIEKDDIIIRPTDLQNDKRSLRTGIAREHGIITSAYIAMKAIKTVNPEYFHYLLHAYDVMKVFYNMGNGVRQGLNFSEFSRLMVFEPTIEEQNAIVAYLKEKCNEIDLAIAEKKQQIETIEEYKKSLIFEYVTGKKEVVNE